MERTVEAQLRKFLLKPLARRRQRAADRKALIEALQRLDHRVLGESLLPQVREIIDDLQKNRSKGSRQDCDETVKSVTIARALYVSRRISTQEYVMHAVSPIERIHDNRWTDGHYDADLDPIRKEMDEVRKGYGLTAEEDWEVGSAPEEYERLDNQYKSVLDRHFVGALREFDLEDLADLFETSPGEFQRLRERGRRSIFHKDELVAALRDVVVRYEEDARKAASAKAYSAAVTLLGAGVEGLLLLRCLRSKDKASKAAQKLPRRRRPRSLEDPTQWTFDNLIEVCSEAGWLPSISTEVADYNSAGLAHVLRLMRNHVHPGKCARERPWIEKDERDYKDAEAIYLILLSRLGHIKSLPKEGRD